MCELLVRMIDNPLTGDPAVDCHRTRRGDVIAAVPDGHPWTPGELANPAWLVLLVPDMSLAEGLSLTAAEPGGAAPDGRPLHKRHFRLDLGALDVLPGHAWGPPLVVTRERVRAARSVKAPHPHPHHLGPAANANVIG